jgi:putative phosphoesterase
MKIGLLSDVHANKPALEAVLADMPEVGAYIHAGDVVGYGPYPSDVIGLFQEHDIVSIQGNHDRGVLGEFNEDTHEIPRTAARWTAERLDEGELAYLETLPVERDLFEGSVHVAHGAPDAPDTYTYPEDFVPDLLSEESVLVLGHTHVQAKAKFNDGIVVNPGSVGLPRDGDWRAAYAVLDLDAASVELHRVEYPKEKTQTRINDSDLPGQLSEGLEHGELVFGRAKRSGDNAAE